MTKSKIIINQTIISGLIYLNYYIANNYYSFYKLTGEPGKYWIWDLPRYLALILLFLLIMLTRFLSQTDFEDRFCFTRIMVFASLYSYLLLVLGVKTVIISLLQTDNMQEAAEAISFGYMLFIMTLTAISSISFSIEFIIQFKKEPEY